VRFVDDQNVEFSRIGYVRREDVFNNRNPSPLFIQSIEVTRRG
jgi:hypothetical protein